MTTHPAWDPPRRLPVLFDVPDRPPPPRVHLTAGMTPLRLAFAVIRSGGWIAVVGCLLLIVFNTASTLVPVALGAAVDRGVGPVTEGASAADAIGQFLTWTAVVAGLYVVINVTYRFGGRMGWFCVQRAQYELSARVVERILDPRGTAARSRLPGRLLSVSTLDTERTCSALYFAIYPLGNVVAIVVTATSLFAIHPTLGVIVMTGAPVLLGVMTRVARPLRTHSEREQEGLADASAAAEDVVRGYRVITGIHAQRAATDHYRGRSRSALGGSLVANRTEATVDGTSTVLTGLFAGAVTIVAAVLAFDGAITVGQLVAAAGLAQVVLTPLNILVQEAASMGAIVLASAARLIEVLDADHHPAALGRASVPRPPTLTIHDGSFGEPVTIGAGELVAVDLPATRALAWADALGLTGATDPGVSVDLGGRPLTDLDPTEVRRTVLTSPHVADLLEPTVLANVHPDLVRARQALAVAHCESLEHELPHGYDTEIGDGGRSLSGGQRQRVALARAIAHDAPVLVLHDPTSSVDAATEHEIALRVRAGRAGAATLVITSSPAFHSVADRSLGRVGR